MPAVTVNTYSSLRRYTPGTHSARLKLEDGATVYTALRALEIPVEQAKIIFVDGRRADLDHCLREGEKVDLFAAVGGG